MNWSDNQGEEMQCCHCGECNKPRASFCKGCGMELRPTLQPVQAEARRANCQVILSRSLSSQELDRLWGVFEAVQGCGFFPHRVLWPDEDGDGGTLRQELPKRTVLLSEARAVPTTQVPTRGWLDLVSKLAPVIDDIHRSGCRLNSIGLSSVIVANDTHEFAGLCLPISLTFLDTPRTALPLAGIDCCFAAPEVQGYVDHPVGPSADVYSLAVLTYYLLTGVAPRDLMECNFCPVRDHPELGPSLRQCLEDALAIIPERRPQSARQFVKQLRKALVQDLCRPGPEVCWASLTDIGIGGRHNNEDACGVWIRCTADAHGRCLVGVAAVADGMGGSAFGERASSLCIDRLLDDSARDLRLLGGSLASPADWVTACRDWILRLNQEVIELGKKLSAPNDIGSTLTAVLFAGRRAFLLHAGDSHLYLFRAGSISRLTRSQTYAEQLHEEGQLTREEVETSIYRNVLTSYIGSPKCIPQVEELHLVAGDTLVLCTDGLMEGLTEEDICDLVVQLPPNEAVAEMVRRCKYQLQTAPSASDTPAGIPCSDNMTAVVVQILGEPTAEPIPRAAEDGDLPTEEPPTGSLGSTLKTQSAEGDTHA